MKMKVKGVIKRRNTAFSRLNQPKHQNRGNTYEYPISSGSAQWISRLNKDDFDKVATFNKNQFITSDTNGNSGNVKLLRPTTKVDNQPVDLKFDLQNKEKFEFDDCSVMYKPAILKMLNDVVKTHNSCSNHNCFNYNVCSDSKLYVAKEIQKGVCCKWYLACSSCDYTGYFKLYKEIEKAGPGCKAAVANIGLQTGLGETALSMERACLVLNAMGVPAPSKKNMQKQANRISDKIKALNDDDMKNNRLDLKRINQLRGNDDNLVNVETDAVYNSQSISRRGEFGRVATCVTGIMCENVTPQKKVIATIQHSKMCKTGAALRINGAEVSCPDKESHQCTANHRQDKDFTEEGLAFEMAQQISHELKIDKVTTDGDSKSAQGIRRSMGDNVENLMDPIHKTQSVFRASLTCLDKDFSANILPYEESSVCKRSLKKAFAADIARRVNKVVANLFSKFDNADAISDKLLDCVNAIINCYDGNCDSCKTELSACRKGKRWWNVSEELVQFKVKKGSINLTKKDRFVLTKILELKLSRREFTKIRFNTTTNKCESINRTINVYAPKTKRYARNSAARVAAAVHARNNETANSLILKLEHVGAGVAKNSKVAANLKSFNSRSQYKSAYKKNELVRKRKVKARKLRSKIYYEKMEGSKEGGSSDYKKGKEVIVVLKKAKENGKKVEKKSVETEKVSFGFLAFSLIS